jgi:predicted transcriptional regulator
MNNMVTKRQDVRARIDSVMANRNIGEVTNDTEQTTEETQGMTQDAQSTTKRYKNTVVSIRFDEGDYEKLKALAQEQGTNGAALIRKAVKDIIKRGSE